MDPLSIATAVLALLGASAATLRTFRKIRDLKKAPELIQSLNNEISDLHLTTLNVNDYIARARANRNALPVTRENLLKSCSE